jgi:hypothetical protein
VVATKTVTGTGRTFGQLEGVFDNLTSEFTGDAGQVILQSLNGGAVTVDLTVTFITEGAGGTGSVTASPPGHSPKATTRPTSARSPAGPLFR